MMRLLALVLLWVLAALPAQAANNNILLLIADDMGIDVATFYRTTVRVPTTPAPPVMPELTALANSGLLFTRSWTTPWCSPTRASIITGQYGFRHGLGVPIDQSTPTVVLPSTAVTLPKVVGDSSRNYILRHIGKWHLSEGTNDPYTYGWTTWTGPNPGAGGPASSGTGSPNYFNWRKYTGGSGGSTNTLTTKYATTDQVDDAIAAISAANTANRPYFIWLAFNAPHSPFHEPPSGLLNTALPGTPTNRQKYAAALEALDTEIGRLLDNVNLSTTTVIFIGDNGTPNPGDVVASPYSQDKAKGSVYDPGMHTPLIIAGQGVTGAGRTINELVQCVDLFPTIVDLAAANSSSRLTGLKIDGISLTPYLENKTHPNPRRYAYGEEFPGTYNAAWERAIRNGDFVLIERASGTTREFYNLALDPLQNTNILGLSRSRTALETANLNDLDAAMDALLATR